MSAPLQSASQVSLKRECERKYAFSYVYGLRSPETPSQTLGKDVDDNQLQPYLRDGRPFEFTHADGSERVSGRIAASGVHLLPKPARTVDGKPGTPGLEVQRHFVMPSPSKLFSYQGYLDLWLPKRGLPDMAEVSCIVHAECLADPEGAGRKCASQYDDLITLPIVADFKTTKAKKWAKTRAGLAVDVQAQLYATWAMWATGARVVDLAWLYFQTEGARVAYRTIGRVTAAHTYEQILAIDATGREIHALRQEAAGLAEGSEAAKEFALSRKPNPAACDNFGGCPYRSICNLSPSDFVDSIEPSTSAGANTGTDTSDKPWRLPIVSETIDLFASLERRAEPAEPVVLGINPPEAKSLPPAPPVGTVTVTEAAVPAEGKPKRTRRTKAQIEADEAQIAKDTAEIRAAKAVAEVVEGLTPEAAADGFVASDESPPTLNMTEFQHAWAELGVAVARVLMIGSKGAR